VRHKSPRITNIIHAFISPYVIMQTTYRTRRETLVRAILRLVFPFMVTARRIRRLDSCLFAAMTVSHVQLPLFCDSIAFIQRIHRLFVILRHDQYNRSTKPVLRAAAAVEIGCVSRKSPVTTKTPSIFPVRPVRSCIARSELPSAQCGRD